MRKKLSTLLAMLLFVFPSYMPKSALEAGVVTQNTSSAKSPVLVQQERTNIGELKTTQKQTEEANVVLKANIEEPKVEEPKVEEPKVEEPKIEEPKIEEPKVEEPKVEEPKVEEPKVEEPKIEEPKVEEPKIEDPKIEEPKVEEPQIRLVTVQHYVETAVGSGSYTIVDSKEFPFEEGSVVSGSNYIQEFSGFTFNRFDLAEITVSESNNEIRLYYTMNPVVMGTITVKHYIEKDKGSGYFVLAKTSSSLVAEGTTISGADYKQIFTGYTYSHSDSDGYVVSADGLTIKLYYTKN